MYMEKKRGLWLLILLASIRFASAQSFGIGEILDIFGGDNILLIGAFVISFALIFFILTRLPMFQDKFTRKPDKKIPGVIAFVISLFIIYGIHQYNFDLGSFFSGYGVGGDTLYSIAAIASIIGVIYALWKYKSKVLLVAGILLIGFSLTGWAYESSPLMIAGITLVVLWLILKFLGRGKKERLYAPHGVEDVNRKFQIQEEEIYKKKIKEMEERRKLEREGIARANKAMAIQNRWAMQKELEKREREEDKKREAEKVRYATKKLRELRNRQF